MLRICWKSNNSVLQQIVDRSTNNGTRSYCRIAGIKEWLRQYQGGNVDLNKDEDSGIAVVTLNHLEKRNAITGKMMADLADITDELELWKAGKGVIVHGAGNTFCSGGDLNFVRGIKDSVSGEKMCTFMQDTLWRFFSLPLVSVALVTGKALGGGAEIAVACDFRVVTERVSIGFVQTRMGVSTGFGGGTRLVQLLGRTRSLELLISGRILSWKEAVEIGLANGRVDETDSLQHTKDWLQERIKGSADVTRSMKSLVVGAVNSNTLESLANEKTLFTSVWGGPAHQDAVNNSVKYK